jgi:hypothetical protein
VTVTGPFVALAGTVAVMLVADHDEIVVAVMPLNLTVLAPCDAPKLFPAMVTLPPMGAAAGLNELIVGNSTV